MTLFISLFLIGVGLSMDAFAVSVCKGLSMRKVNKKQTFIIGLFFGGFPAKWSGNFLQTADPSFQFYDCDGARHR